VDIISFNDDEMLEDVFKRQGEQIACVLLEPIIGNAGAVWVWVWVWVCVCVCVCVTKGIAGSISATPRWLQRLRQLCT